SLKFIPARSSIFTSTSGRASLWSLSWWRRSLGQNATDEEDTLLGHVPGDLRAAPGCLERDGKFALVYQRDAAVRRCRWSDDPRRGARALAAARADMGARRRSGPRLHSVRRAGGGIGAGVGVAGGDAGLGATPAGGPDARGRHPVLRRRYDDRRV